MDILLSRVTQVGDATIGKVTIGGSFSCHSLEDVSRPVKVAGKTRIPAGRYRLKFREVLSGLTQRYRAKYPWFTWHLELQGVPGFQYVYVHVGNKAADTEGCILLGKTWDGKSPFIGSSAVVFAEFYKLVSDAIKRGEDVFIEVVDEPSPK